MSRLNYLKELYAKGNFNELRDTWYVLGSFEVTNKTKAYIKDTIIKVSNNDGLGCDNCLIYVTENYLVGGHVKEINWREFEKDKLSSLCINVNGTLTPCFFVLLSNEEFSTILEPINEDYEPFEEETKRKGFAPVHSSVMISDSDLNMIMSEIGMPFLEWDEVEYSRETICELCVKPALQRYYREYPIVERIQMGPYSPRDMVEIPLPENCTGVLRAEFRQGGTATAGGFNGVHQYMNEKYQLGTMGTGGYRMGRGIRYNKPVPGYTGNGNGSLQSLSMLNRSISQAVTNYHKRVRFNIEINKETGQRVAKGFSSIGGMLDVEFKYWSPNFDLVEFDCLEFVRNYASAKALRALSSIRMLLKSDTPGALDFSSYASRAKELEDRVEEFYKARPKSIVLRGEA